jgi:hypothetical protein
MKSLLITVLLSAMIIPVCLAEKADTSARKEKTVLRHLVMFQFKAGTSKEAIAAIDKAFTALPGKIKEIQSFESGVDLGLSDLSDGLTHCYLLSFKNKEDLDVYAKHADHLAFVAKLKPVLERPVVLDYTTPAKP